MHLAKHYFSQSDIYNQHKNIRKPHYCTIKITKIILSVGSAWPIMSISLWGGLIAQWVESSPLNPRVTGSMLSPGKLYVE